MSTDMALTHAIRDGSLSPGMTVPSSHPPYGFARHPNGGLLHRVERVVLRWSRGHLVRIAAAWECGRFNFTTDAALVKSPAGFRSCSGCDVHDTMPRGQSVYVARCTVAGSDLIKVGCTTNLAARLTTLERYGPTTLLGHKPGGGREEKVALSEIASFRLRGREWFSPDCLPALSAALGIDITSPAIATEEVAG